MRRGPVKANCNRTSQASRICLLEEKSLSVDSVEIANLAEWDSPGAAQTQERPRSASFFTHGSRNTGHQQDHPSGPPGPCRDPTPSFYSLLPIHYALPGTLSSSRLNRQIVSAEHRSPPHGTQTTGHDKDHSSRPPARHAIPGLPSTHHSLCTTHSPLPSTHTK